MSKRRLIVEGEADREFFSALCRELGVRDIWIGPPRELGQGGNGKHNAFQALKDALTDIETGHVTHLGIVVDADFTATGTKNGLAAARNEIDTIASSYGYSLAKSDSTKGLFYSHSKGLPQIGAWIMPDNKSDGYLEQFCLESAAPSEAALVASAKQAVTRLTNQKFPPHKKVKAEVSTWLAWQTEPGQGLNSLIGGKLIDTTRASYQNLSTWLTTVF